MPIYNGFSTQNVNQPLSLVRAGVYGGIGTTTVQPRIGKKFALSDQNLVIRDLLNALSIKQGDKVGQPTYVQHCGHICLNQAHKKLNRQFKMKFVEL